MRVAVITHNTSVNDTDRYVSVKHSFSDAVACAVTLVMDKLMTGDYAGDNDFVIDVVDRETDEVGTTTIVRIIDDENGDEYEAYTILDTQIN